MLIIKLILTQPYKKCNKEFVRDLNDLYLRIGHSLLDDKMKEYGRYSKIYFRGIINENYKNANVQDWVDAKNKVSEQYEEYESMCVKVGRERM